MELQREYRRGGTVEIRFRVPLFVAEWLSEKAAEQFKYRNTYIRDMLFALYRRERDGR